MWVGRHADVDERDIGSLVAHAREQRAGIADLGDDVEPRFGEQRGNALADQRRIVGDHDPHGISTLMVVPAPRLALDDQLGVQHLQPVAEACQTRIGGSAGATHSVVRDGHAKVPARALEAAQWPARRRRA